MRKALFRKLRELGYDIGGWCGCVEPPNHVHLVIDCKKFIFQPEISKIWHSITGDSFIVDIRAVKGNNDGYRRSVDYISKYINKISNWKGLNLEILKGFHIINSNGLVPCEKRFLECPCCSYKGPWFKILEAQYYGEGLDLTERQLSLENT